MDFKRIFYTCLFLILISFITFAAGSCTLNGQPVECPQFLNDYGWLIAVVIVLVVLGAFAFVLFSFYKAWSTGSISIVLPKNSFAEGETVTGTMVIELKKEVETTSSAVGLIAEVTRKVTRNGNRTSETSTVFSIDNPIVIQQNYPIGKREVPFSIVIPLDAHSKGKLDASGLGAVGQAINFIQDVAMPKPRWYIEVELTTKSGVTLSNRTEIHIN